jgi:Haemolysin-III related
MRSALLELSSRPQRPVVVAGAQVAAALLGVQWPTARWPVYVFLAGAMACLLTSATCHLLACCSFEAGPAAAQLKPSCSASIL